VLVGKFPDLEFDEFNNWELDILSDDRHMYFCTQSVETPLLSLGAKNIERP